MKKIIPVFLVLLFFVGCNNKSFFIDDKNEEKQGLRIVSLAPSITNMIVALGGGDYLVGVTKFCNNPEKKWTEIGGYMDFNKEAFLSLKPNLVFLAPYHSEAIEICNNQGIEYVELDLTSFRAIRPNIMTIAKKIGRVHEGTVLVDKFNKEMLSLKRSDKHPKVLVVLDRDYGTKNVGKCYVVGDGGIFAEPISLVGGINAYEGLVETPVLTNEGIIKLNPDVIIDVVNRDLVKGDISKDWAELDINAVKKNNCYVLDDKGSFIPDEKFYIEVKKLSEIISSSN